ncbi:hypothetical protein YPPY102_0857, partial [Yersinia pestis PY-102]
MVLTIGISPPTKKEAYSPDKTDRFGSASTLAIASSLIAWTNVL